MMYKDRSEVNHRNDSDFLQVLHEEAEWLKRYHVDHEDKKMLKKLFLPEDGIYAPNEKDSKQHYPKHEQCSGIKKGDTNKVTEKRICRCMFYYGKNPIKCQNCFLIKKWQNVGNIIISNYEWPTIHVYKRIGGMDLILDDKYAVEVKPVDSTETLTRMIAEILTYTLDCEKAYEPGICFFEGSQQMEDFENYRSNEDLKYILNFIKPFYIKIVENGNLIKYKILPYK